MPKTKHTNKADRSMPGAKNALIAALITPLITAFLGLCAILVVVFPSVFSFVRGVAGEESAFQTRIAATERVPTPNPPIGTVLLSYVNVDEANVYEQKDTTSRVFDTIVRCTQVVVYQEKFDPDWLYVSYWKENLEYKGFVQTKQFSNSRSECRVPNADPVP